MDLVIVESPTKAKTIGAFLKKGYAVKASFGHVRDLPPKNIGIDVKNDFEQEYAILPKAKKTISELKKLASASEYIIMATDEDREGEAIAWHLQEILKIPDKRIKRIVFHEITKSAIDKALEHPRSINMNFIDSYRARRILDRLVGYKLSPFLWRTVARGLSAGRVQSPALRLICEREEEINQFKPVTFYKVIGEFGRSNGTKLIAILDSVGGKKIKKPGILEKSLVDSIASELQGQQATIKAITKKARTNNPPPPYKTSTLQQDAFRRLGMSSKSTMFVAQKLYEGVAVNGTHQPLITYHRTDSLNLSDDFVRSVFAYGKSNFPDILADTAQIYKTKSKVAFEAHEAIHPIDISITPESVRGMLENKFFKLYDLIWRRAIASQCKPMHYEEVGLEIVARDVYQFLKVGNRLVFDGFGRIYPVRFKEELLPADVREGEQLSIDAVNVEEKQTKPPARYNDAQLIKKLEEFEIGRPSTYASIISTLLDRNYVTRNLEKRLQPTEVGTLVNKVLVEHFKNIVDYNFTAKMEGDLDLIAENKENWLAMIKNFYTGFAVELKEKSKLLKKSNIIASETITEECPNCKTPLIARFSKFGKFYACPNYPTCKFILRKSAQQKDKAPLEEIDELCPNCQVKLVARLSRFGKFFACPNFPKCKYILKKNQKTKSEDQEKEGEKGSNQE